MAALTVGVLAAAGSVGTRALRGSTSQQREQDSEQRAAQRPRRAAEGVFAAGSGPAVPAACIVRGADAPPCPPSSRLANDAGLLASIVSRFDVVRPSSMDEECAIPPHSDLSVVLPCRRPIVALAQPPTRKLG